MMENKALNLYIIIYFLPVIFSTFSIRIGIIQFDSDKKFCEDGTNMSFEVIENISSVITSNVSLIVCPKEVSLSAVISVKNLRNIVIHGRKGKINCKGESGFEFINATNLSLQSLTFSGCYMKTVRPASVFVLNSADIAVFQVSIVNSPGTGLLVQNTAGIVEIQNCTFESNGQHVSINFQNTSVPSTYNLSSCLFSLTHREPKFDKEPKFGGGLNIVVNGSQHIRISVSMARFLQNYAEKGGGMSLRYSNSQDCTIELATSGFMQNNATEGGGVYVDVYSSSSTTLEMAMKDCYFNNNYAMLGGGTRLTSTKIEKRGVLIIFVNVTWSTNTALYGSAFCVMADTTYAAVSGFLPDLKFSNTNFTGNKVSRLSLAEHTGNVEQYVEQYVEGSGSLYCSNFILNFSEVLDVVNNNGTAFRLESCTMHLAANSRAIFADNKGFYGGAVHLRSSQIIAGSWVRVHFLNNIAYGNGGAIHYYTSTTLWTKYTKMCFLLKESQSKGVVFNFSDNYRSKNGCRFIDSMYVLSLEPCMALFGINRSSYNASTFFSSVGSFYFEPNVGENHIHTTISKSDITSIKNKVTKVVPGKPLRLLIKSMTDLDKLTEGLFSVRVHTMDETKVSAYPDSVLNDSTITFSGCPRDKAEVLLSTITARKITMKFSIELVNCPPGFAISDMKCICITKQNGVADYDGIDRCDNGTFEAHRTRGMWVWHAINRGDTKSGYCPSGYCSEEDLLMWESGSPEILNVCQEGRQGILCGACISNYSVYYHSRHYHCGKTDLCYLGWLFYILTEIVPVTVLFITIIYSDKSLSSGLANGFVFYAQVLLTLRIGGEKYFELPSSVRDAQGLHSIFYGIFNLNFFVHKKLAFCLWKTADSLSIMAMDYLTQAYSLALVFALVILLKYSHRLHSIAKPMGVKLPSTARSTIHGITAFLILTYSQNVTISIALLRPGFVYQSGSYETVVHYLGAYKYSDLRYIPYALLASTILTWFVLLPTFLLILYPIHYKILLLLNVSESQCIMKVVSPLEKIKPLFDSFQSTFKDNFRFFSGLYFLYRLVIGLTFTINTPANYHILIEGELIVILIIHSVCQPYKEAHHNVVNSLLLGNLALINTLSLLHLYYELYPKQGFLSTKVTGTIQVILLYAPIVAALGFVCKKVINSLKARKDHEIQEETSASLIELESLCEVDRNSDLFEPSCSYKLQSN